MGSSDNKMVRKHTTPPTLSAAERKAALQKGIRVRRDRAELKDGMRRDPRMATKLIEASAAAEDRGDDSFSGIKVIGLLLCLPGIGPVSAKEWMEELRISPSRRVGGLGYRQRNRLSASITDYLDSRDRKQARKQKVGS